MAGINVTGLTTSSTFDWQSFVTTIVGQDRTAQENPLQARQTTNAGKTGALSTIQSDLTTLQSTVATLNTVDLFNARTATSSASGWTVLASAGAPAGVYNFNVSQLATASSLTGTTNLAAPLAATADVSGVSLATLGTATNPTAGIFTVNGAQVSVSLGDSLQDLFGKISAATGGAVTAAYDPGTDHITLASASPIVLGAANDTSNFLSVARLDNNGTGAIGSSARLGALSRTATLASARLGTPITAVDGSGNGSFTINGVSIAYNVNTDSLNAVLARINASAAGVTAAYDAKADHLSITNRVTGDLGLSLSEGAGGFLGAFGLASGTTLARGLNALYTVNGGATIVSPSNTLTDASHGLAGLTVTPTTMGTTETVTVTANTTAMRTNIQAFLAAYNAVQNDITSQTQVISANGQVTTGPLSSDHDVQDWGHQLRNAVFTAVPGLGGAISRLQDIGIDFTSNSSNLAIKDSTALDNALTNQPDVVSAFFQQSGTGFAAKLGTLFNGFLGTNNQPGLIAGKLTAFTKDNTDITTQIATIETRLAVEKAQLTASFLTMQNAQSSFNQMQTVLDNLFGNNSNSNSKK